jgi:lipoprotein-anchoring transpeptidase ErfK/SrfK
MRASPLVSAVAAGLVSLSAAVAEETSTTAASPLSVSSPAVSPAVIATVPERSDQTKSGPVAAADAKAETATQSEMRAGAAKATPPVPVARKRSPPSLVVKINLSSQRLELHYDGRLQDSWPISSGREGFATPRGVFRPQWASKMWYSRKYDNAPMPHAVFFNGGVAVHGTQSIRALGQPASHGCVRLAPANAARFYALVHQHGYARTRIEVFGTPPPPRVAHRAAPGASRTASVPQKRFADPRLQPRPQATGWMQPGGSQQQLNRRPNGLVYLPANSPYRGQSSFVHNGVVYMRVR